MPMQRSLKMRLLRHRILVQTLAQQHLLLGTSPRRHPLLRMLDIVPRQEQRFFHGVSATERGTGKWVGHGFALAKKDSSYVEPQQPGQISTSEPAVLGTQQRGSHSDSLSQAGVRESATTSTLPTGDSPGLQVQKTLAVAKDEGVGVAALMAQPPRSVSEAEEKALSAHQPANLQDSTASDPPTAANANPSAAAMNTAEVADALTGGAIVDAPSISAPSEVFQALIDQSRAEESLSHTATASISTNSMPALGAQHHLEIQRTAPNNMEPGTLRVDSELEPTQNQDELTPIMNRAAAQSISTNLNEIALTSGILSLTYQSQPSALVSESAQSESPVNSENGDPASARIIAGQDLHIGSAEDQRLLEEPAITGESQTGMLLPISTPSAIEAVQPADTAHLQQSALTNPPNDPQAHPSSSSAGPLPTNLPGIPARGMSRRVRRATIEESSSGILTSPAQVTERSTPGSHASTEQAAPQLAPATERAITNTTTDTDTDPSTERTADSLFVSHVGSNRSPAAWAARLAGVGVAQPAPPDQRQQTRLTTQDKSSDAVDAKVAQDSPPDQLTPIAVAATSRQDQLPTFMFDAQSRRESEEPTPPLAEPVRRFLHPLVGIDPAGIRVRRDAYADEIAAAHEADAVTFGSNIFLAQGQINGSPEDLGLLAHELTHVARQSNPRFVPPLLRNIPPDEGGADISTNNEEVIAQRVEAEVIGVARARTGQRSNQPVVQPEMHSQESPIMAAPTLEGDIEDQGIAPTIAGSKEHWGNLPAPWEPLPDWMTSSPAAAPGPSHQEAFVVAENPLQAEFVPSIQRAAHSRSLEDSSPASLPESQIEHEPEPKPDLDALARQVYNVLKQRLAVERRREG